MPQEQVQTSLSDESRDSIIVEYNFGDNLADAVEKFGEDVVFARFVSAARVDLQGYVRGLMRKTNEEGDFEHSDDVIVQKAGEWRPSMRKPGKSAKEKTLDLIDKLSDEEREELMAALSE